MKKNAVAAAFCAAFVLFVSCSEKKDVRAFNAMDTFMTVQSYGKNCAAANRQVEEQVKYLESIFSVTDENSDIYRLNHGKTEEGAPADEGTFSAAGAPATQGASRTASAPSAESAPRTASASSDASAPLVVSVETWNLVSFALEMAAKTEGALNPALYPLISSWGFTTGSYRVPSDAEISALLKKTDYTQVRPYTFSEKDEENCTETERFAVSMKNGMELDLGAVGKGYAGDAALKILELNGIQSALLDFGGNIQTLGRKPDGSLWQIGIKNPWDGTVCCGVSVENQAVITSGGYERSFTAEGQNYIHIFDGTTGRPVDNGIKSVSIVCDSGLYGDALSTALFVMGVDKALSFWKEYRDFDFIIITEDESLYYSSGLKGKIKFLYDFYAANCID